MSNNLSSTTGVNHMNLHNGTSAEPQRLLAFSLCKEEYAMPLLKVKEVIANQEITHVPYTPLHFKGILNLRGQVISVIDLRLKLNMSEANMSDETAIIILDIHPLCLGVIVDSVNSVLTVQDSELCPPPRCRAGYKY